MLIPSMMLTHLPQMRPYINIYCSQNASNFNTCPNVIAYSEEIEKNMLLSSPILNAEMAISKNHILLFSSQIPKKMIESDTKQFTITFRYNSKGNINLPDFHPSKSEEYYTRISYLALHLKTASETYIYATPGLLLSNKSFNPNYKLHALITFRKHEFIDYLTQFKTKVYFGIKSELSPENHYSPHHFNTITPQPSSSSLKRMQENPEDLHVSPKKRKLNSIEALEGGIPVSQQTCDRKVSTSSSMTLLSNNNLEPVYKQTLIT